MRCTKIGRAMLEPAQQTTKHGTNVRVFVITDTKRAQVLYYDVYIAVESPAKFTRPGSLTIRLDSNIGL
jgi:hypothetical protein